MWDALGFLLIAFASSDILSTEILLLNNPQGFYEANPLLPSPQIRIPVKIGVTAFVWWGTEKLRRDHPKKALALRIATVALWGSATAWNLRQALE